jgi:hypothetical protein
MNIMLYGINTYLACASSAPLTKDCTLSFVDSELILITFYRWQRIKQAGT